MIPARLIVHGLLTFVRPPSRYTYRPVETISARYCYSVFLRHLVKVHAATGRIPLGRIAELGPGGSLGTGLAAMIAGARHYFALDAQAHSEDEASLRVFDELVELFSARADVPGPDEFPEVRPTIADYAFPRGILGDAHMDAALEQSRLEELRRHVASASSADNRFVAYVAPWHDSPLIREQTIDWIFSQAVLEHVADLPAVYRAFAAWLAPNGVMSHQIDFRSHGTAPSWDGHRGYGDLTWRAIRGAQPFLINREPLSTHRKLARDLGFDLLAADFVTTPPELTRTRLARRFRTWPDEDLRTSGAFVVYRKSGQT
jgi:SAM-dependent methyltransferase